MKVNLVRKFIVSQELGWILAAIQVQYIIVQLPHRAHRFVHWFKNYIQSTHLSVTLSIRCSRFPARRSLHTGSHRTSPRQHLCIWWSPHECWTQLAGRGLPHKGWPRRLLDSSFNCDILWGHISNLRARRILDHPPYFPCDCCNYLCFNDFLLLRLGRWWRWLVEKQNTAIKQ